MFFQKAYFSTKIITHSSEKKSLWVTGVESRLHVSHQDQWGIHERVTVGGLQTLYAHTRGLWQDWYQPYPCAVLCLPWRETAAVSGERQVCQHDNVSFLTHPTQHRSWWGRASWQHSGQCVCVCMCALVKEWELVPNIPGQLVLHPREDTISSGTCKRLLLLALEVLLRDTVCKCLTQSASVDTWQNMLTVQAKQPESRDFSRCRFQGDLSLLCSGISLSKYEAKGQVFTYECLFSD